MTKLELAERIVNKGIYVRQLQRDFYSKKTRSPQAAMAAERELDALHVMWQRAQFGENLKVQETLFDGK